MLRQAAFATAILVIAGVVLLACDAFDYSNPRPTSSGPPPSGGLAPPELTRGDEFGSAVASDGQLLLVGAPASEVMVGDQRLEQAGTIYVFMRAGNGWMPAGRVNAAVPTRGDRFGASLALTADTLAVGAPGNDSVADRAGVVFLFARSGNQFTPAMPAM